MRHEDIRNFILQAHTIKKSVILAGTVWQLAKVAKHFKAPVADALFVDEAAQLSFGSFVLALGLLKGHARVVLAGDHLQLGPLLAVKIAVNQELVGPGQVLCSGDEVAFLPPFTGG